MPETDAPETDAPESAAPSRRSGPLPVIALVVSLVALGLAGWAAFKPPARADAADAYTDAERAAARTEICSAVDVVRKGVSTNTNLQAPGGEADVTGSLAVAGNARVSLAGGGQYLLAKIGPATPQPLADEANAFANTLLDIGAASIAGALNSDPDQAARLQRADALNGRLVDGCR